MGYPPSARRMGDSKRYYYSNNPNRRHSSQMAYPKKPYQGGQPSRENPYSHESNTHGSMIDRTGTPTMPSGHNANTSSPSTPTQSQNQTQSAHQNDVPRTSRYDPSPIQRSSSAPHRPTGLVSRKSTSRYNSSIDYPSATSPHKSEIADIPRSRYSGSSLSRYNSHTNPAPTVAQSIKNGVSSPASNNKPLLMNKSPRTSESSVFGNEYSMSSYRSPNSNNPSSNTSYFTRANKWRMGSNPDLKNEHEHPSMNRQPLTAPSNPSTRNKFWKHSTPKYPSTVSPQTKFSESFHSQRHDSNSSINMNYDKHRPSFSEYQENEKKWGGKSANSQHEEHEKDDETRSPLGSPNPHSLGSSLINSVSQTTRETEAQLLKDLREKEGRVKKVRSTSINKPSQNILHKAVATNNGESTLWTSVDKNENSMKDNIMEDTGIPDVANRETTINEFDDPDGDDDDNNDTNDIQDEDDEGEADEDDRLADISNTVFTEMRPSDMLDYEYIYDPTELQTNFSNIKIKNEPDHYTIPLKPINEYIFPMNRVETKLWQLKNKSREEIVKKQKYLLKKPLREFKAYPFWKRNLLVHEQAIRGELANTIGELVQLNRYKELMMKKMCFQTLQDWKDKCGQMSKISESLRSKEIEYQEKLERENQEREEQEKIAEEKRRHNNSSRRRNRADFVDDAEMETVLLQIDPDYKFHQAAAVIPKMITDPLKRSSYKFCDLNNLETDKDKWASRVLLDGIDNFTPNEHELFVEGYLMNPKKFSRISNFMGGLRTPEECVLHYYRTKRTVDYKSLVNERNKKRKGITSKKKKKKERSSEAELELDTEQSTDVKEVTTEHAAEVSNIGDSQQQIEITKTDETDYVEVGVVREPIEDDNIAVDTEVIIPTESKHEPENTNVKPDHHSPEPPVQDSLVEPVQPTQEISQEVVHNVKPSNDTYESNPLQHNDAITEHTGDFTTILPRPSPNMSPVDLGFEDGGLRKKQKQSHDHRTSYWSVKETQAFPDLLKEFGSQWSLISQKLATKSTTMVRNYYQRNAAQFGWKSIVEEADAKRNAKSSGLVQQSQILLPPEPPVFNIVNGIPPQTRPAMNYFGTQVKSETGQLYSGITAQPFNAENTKDAFSTVTTPTSTLPPPRLPTIQFQGNTEGPIGHIAQMSTKPINGTAGGTPGQDIKAEESSNISARTEDHRHNSINSLLNASPDNRPNIIPRPHDDSRTSTTIRSSSISSLLNPDSGQPPPKATISHKAVSISPPPIQKFVGSTINGTVSTSVPTPRIFSEGNLKLHQLPPMTTTVSPTLSNDSPTIGQHPQLIRNGQAVDRSLQNNSLPPFNFANDPLAALAAIASAPETVSSFISKDKEQQ